MDGTASAAADRSAQFTTPSWQEEIGAQRPGNLAPARPPNPSGRAPPSPRPRKVVRTGRRGWWDGAVGNHECQESVRRLLRERQNICDLSATSVAVLARQGPVAHELILIPRPPVSRQILPANFSPDEARAEVPYGTCACFNGRRNAAGALGMFSCIRCAYNSI